MQNYKFCENCGKKINANSHFCPFCGHQMNTNPSSSMRHTHQAPSQPTYYHNSRPNNSQPPYRPHSNRGLIIALIVAVIIIGIGIMVVINVSSEENDPVNQIGNALDGNVILPWFLSNL